MIASRHIRDEGSLFHRDDCCPKLFYHLHESNYHYTQVNIINNFASQTVIFCTSPSPSLSLQSGVSAFDCPLAPLCRPRFSQPFKSPKFHFATSTLFIPLSRPSIGQLGRSAVERGAALHNDLRRKRRRRRRRRNEERGQEVQGCRYETRCSPTKTEGGRERKKKIKKRSWRCDSVFFAHTAVVEKCVIVMTVSWDHTHPQDGTCVCSVCSFWYKQNVMLLSVQSLNPIHVSVCSDGGRHFCACPAQITIFSQFCKQEIK